MDTRNYIGRFAPSPTGPLHAGSLATALASWLDARAHNGRWLVRIEDVDTTRSVAGMDRIILQQLTNCGLRSDLPVVYQSRRSALYQSALDSLLRQKLAYPCGCTRRDIEAELARLGRGKQRHGELRYPGTCRGGAHDKTIRSWRFATSYFIENQLPAHIYQGHRDTNSVAFSESAASRKQVLWYDRRYGQQRQDVEAEVGDFVLKRADGCYTYQLAVVVDDAAQGVTDIVRGEDLVDSTARQILLQRALALPQPRYLHLPLVLGADHEKLSKQTGAVAIDTREPLVALNHAATFLGLSAHAGPLPEALRDWSRQWLVLCPKNLTTGSENLGWQSAHRP